MADYNGMYEKLVTSEVDVKGLLAYGLYKREKREHILAYMKEHEGARPSKQNIDNFVAIVSRHLDTYRENATKIYMKSVRDAVEAELNRNDERKELVNSIVEEANRELTKVERNYSAAVESAIGGLPEKFDEYQKKSSAKAFWKSAFSSAVGSLLFAVFVVVIIVVIRILYSDQYQNIGEILKNL